ncbi:class A beta-lactamase-related serine hydrolase [Cereibacter sphaeroides]|uniref:serine hydrolase domain-containing protein n=1 Tax=Cereibacter sphaeroides TaxID=1063 RepID=UPI000E5AF3B7|nr:serine hydrolase domain-containing protein [Cereibacter sphaeroides]RHZ91541.1 class A beta-lactamase-related serine hydrolase [Cereibacter sphaeroides]
MTPRRRIFSCILPAPSAEVADSGGALLFPYWSFTKTVIAIIALRLAEGGKISLDQPLRERPFTLRQLLNHTAGLPDYGTLPAYHRAVANDEVPWSRDDLLQVALAQGMRFAPGCGWAYSNVGYMLARELVEEAAGQSLGDLVKDMISVPLGLRSLELAIDRKQFSRVHWGAAQRYHPGWVYHGCLIGTPRDAALLLHALFAGKILRTTSLQQMLTCVPVGGAIDGRPWTECGYGLGLMSGRMGLAGRAIGHSGGGPFSVNAIYHFPDQSNPRTVASFTDGCDEGLAEFAAVRCSGTQ